MANPFHIDQDDIESEWLRQPKLVMKYGERLADAYQADTIARNQLEAGYARIARFVRRNPEKYDIKRVSEPAVKEAVLNDKRYIALQLAAANSRHELDVAKAAVNALEHKKYALQGYGKIESLTYNNASSDEATTARSEFQQKRKADKDFKAQFANRHGQD